MISSGRDPHALGSRGLVIWVRAEQNQVQMKGKSFVDSRKDRACIILMGPAGSQREDTLFDPHQGLKRDKHRKHGLDSPWQDSDGTPGTRDWDLQEDFARSGIEISK